MIALESERSKGTLSSEEFKERVQQLNLEQAKCAQREMSIDDSIAYYAKEDVSPKVIARLVFESSRQTTLREWQQDELERTFTDTLPKIERNEPFSVFTYQPPGAGKSTGLEMQTYIACEKCKEIEAKGGKKKMVVVLAPPANLPDLKKGLSDFYGARGMSFKHIDLSGRSSFDIEKPEKIYQSMIDNNGPIGLSSVDFAALLLKRKKLVQNSGNLNSEEKKQLDALDKIINGIERDGVNFVDEADSIIQPMTNDTNEANKNAVNKILGGTYNIKDIQKALSEGKASMRQCHSMSATMGSSYGELELSGASSPENLDQFVRSAKVSSYGIHLNQIMSMKPLFFESDGNDGGEAAAAIKKWAECTKARGEQDHDLNLVDAQKDGHDAEYLLAVSQALTEHTGMPKELVYYSDVDKKEMKFDPNDTSGERGSYDLRKGRIGSQMTKDEVAYWAESKGKQSHTVFNKTDLIGRDGKQHLKKDGLILRDLDLSTNLSAQTYGRVQRDSDAYNFQRLYNGVNTKKVIDRISDLSLKRAMTDKIDAFRESEKNLSGFLSSGLLNEEQRKQVDKLKVDIESKTLSLDLEKNSHKSLDVLHKESLQKELETLRQELSLKLSELGIKDDDKLTGLLVKHAEASHERDFEYQKTKVAMMVIKEFNERTQVQEDEIAAASVTGALSSAYAVENVEFQEKAKQTIDEKCSKISKSRKEKMGGDDIVENARLAMQDRITKVELRRTPEEVSLASVSELVKPDSLEDNIDTAFDIKPEMFFNANDPGARERAEKAEKAALSAGIAAKDELVNNLSELIDTISQYSHSSISNNKGKHSVTKTERTKAVDTLNALIDLKNSLARGTYSTAGRVEIAMNNTIRDTIKNLQGGYIGIDDLPGKYRSNQLVGGIERFFKKYCQQVRQSGLSQVSGLSNPLVWRLSLDVEMDDDRGGHFPKMLNIGERGATARNNFLIARKRAAVCTTAKSKADKADAKRISEIRSYFEELRDQLKEDAREINRKTIVPQIKESEQKIHQRVEYAQKPEGVKQALLTPADEFVPESKRPHTRPKSSHSRPGTSNGKR